MRTAILLEAVVLLAGSAGVNADITTTINPKSNWGIWEGWGTSLAWWAKAFGSRDDLADVFFTLQQTQVNGQSLPGLGFNIARYNAGACSWNSYKGERMVESPRIKRSRQVEGFWVDWASTDPMSSSWDWSVDVNQRAALQKAIARGANKTELFSNSPMWWMTKNHNPSGAANGGENIQSWNLEQHAIYMATVAQQFKNRWGIEFESVDPFNEPSANWWKADGTQEGCHIDVATQAKIIGYLDTHLTNRGLATQIVASDESLYDQAVNTLRNIGSTAVSQIGRIQVHGYQKGGGDRAGLRKLADNAGKPLWNSEYGDGTGSGADMVRNLLLDMRYLKPTAWAYWQVLDGGGWALITADNDAGTLGSANQKLFVLAQFTRHIRPGMQILDGGSNNVVAAYDARTSKLVVVAVNWDASQNVNFELSGFAGRPAPGTKVKRWGTGIGSGDRYVQYSDVAISGTRFSSYIARNGVQTFEVTGIQL
ncbi:endo-beta-1,6-galactanase [Decorospora gaudefroyi]|uniref:Endo-beta-1,6-galactanase n=1 Tax=Decorospora gaudefroyi TaxID=184978 RepID=A0A6A5KC47_9PLEO|nr:endo-beta-1,6-galactanase [Decorospora gaudefroyi]